VLTELHRPTLGSEAQRITAAGGKVMFGRVQGILAVSRAFGDLSFKSPANGSALDFVSADPFVAKERVRLEDQFLVIACDGLWDKLTYQEVTDMVAKGMWKWRYDVCVCVCVCVCVYV
jgi:serine/threonine protein phosphatase PrpC